MKFRPCIDLHNGKVKQIVGSTLTDNDNSLETNFESSFDSSYYAELYKKDDLTGGHIIMLGAGNKEAALSALAAYPNQMQIGGGINSDNAQYFLDAGASHIIVTSSVFKDGNINWDNLENLVNKVTRKKIVLDLSCKKKDDNYFVVTDRWQNFTDFKINSDNLKKLSSYCDEFLIHAADVEGKRAGIDEELVQLLSNSCDIPITYAGGIRSIEDFEIIKKIGNDKIDATVGSALDIFGGDLSYQDVIDYCSR